MNVECPSTEAWKPTELTPAIPYTRQAEHCRIGFALGLYRRATPRVHLERTSPPFRGAIPSLSELVTGS